MIWLFLVSLIWGFSFGLIKVNLAGVDPNLLAGVRLFLAFLLFLPFVPLGKWKRLRWKAELQLYILGAVQFGLMYCSLFRAFDYLTGYEVALWTVFTPLYVILADRVWGKRSGRYRWASASLAVIGAAWISYHPDWRSVVVGVFWVQAANLCFGSGQVFWKHWKSQQGSVLSEPACYARIYAGACLVPFILAVANGSIGDLTTMTSDQWQAIAYLGLVASGLCFFLWNHGATQVQPEVLAVFNNLKIPVAAVISIAVFQEEADWIQLIPGTVLLLGAYWLAKGRSVCGDGKAASSRRTPKGENRY